MRIEDYALIGDLQTSALVGRNGSVDWLCLPRFDSASCFTALLGEEKHGRWLIAPAGEVRSVSRRYREGTLVLETDFETADGAARVIDFMPPRDGGAPQLVRIVQGLRGRVPMRMQLIIRFGYGLSVPWVQRVPGGIVAQAGPDAVHLSTPVELHGQDLTTVAEFTVGEGSSERFALSWFPSYERPGRTEDAHAALARTQAWWREWSQRCTYRGEYRDEVLTSLVVLKALTDQVTGAIVAAPTTSLPEDLGGERNWDYRYTWLRDSVLTLNALLAGGYTDEALAFSDAVFRATAGQPEQAQIMYGIAGERRLEEYELDWLPGYEGSRPVRVGNAARDQFQLDVYGEVIDAAAQYAFHDRPLDREMQKVLIGFGNYVVKHWEQPDEGIWEPRDGRKHHTHSRLLCWTALDRLISLHNQGRLRGAPADVYKQNCEAIRRQIEHRGWNDHLQSYASVLGGDQMDASLLLLSWYGFEKAGSPRMRGTYRAIVDQLGTTNGLLYRYHTDPPEGAFAICSFWETEYLALGGGSLAQSHALFRRLLAHRNDLGLYAEEIDPRTGAALGNFPQAFTHVGLIGAALSIRQREKGEQQLGHRPERATMRNSHQEVAR